MFLGNHYVLHTRVVLACYYFLEESPAAISFLNFSILLVSLSVMHGTRVIWLCLAACNCSSSFWLFLPSAAALCLLSSCCFFLSNLPSPLLSSSLFCRWWNYPSPYIIWNMSRWSRTCEKLGIISGRPYITFSSLLCYDALMLQVHDQMMIGMFLRPLLLLLLIFLYIIVL